MLSIDRALIAAREHGLDLVEVSPQAEPPVCRIMDYGKFKFEQKKKQKDAKKKQTFIQVKEVKLRPKTEDHDLLVKIKHVKRFLEEGDKAKVSVVFRGREMAHIELGQVLIRRFIEELGDDCVIEAPPKLEGKTLSMLVGPKPH